MQYTFNSDAEKDLKKIKLKDKKLFTKIGEKLALFEENPQHPSLRVHKLTGRMNNMWSISITMSIRMVYILTEDKFAVFIYIGTHEEVYEKYFFT